MCEPSFRNFSNPPLLNVLPRRKVLGDNSNDGVDDDLKIIRAILTCSGRRCVSISRGAKDFSVSGLLRSVAEIRTGCCSGAIGTTSCVLCVGKTRIEDERGSANETMCHVPEDEY